MGRCQQVVSAASREQCLLESVPGHNTCPRHTPPGFVHEAFAAITRTCDGGCSFSLTHDDGEWFAGEFLRPITFCPWCGGRLTTESQGDES